MPEKIAANWRGLRAEWQAEPAMRFWVEWYDAILEGTTPDWELWHDIVLIEDKHWDAGPEAVAGEIERVKAELKDKRAEKYEDHARSMIVRKAALAPQADCLGKSIEDVIQAINKELGQQNQTPACMEPLYQVPQILRNISIELTASNTEDTRLAELTKLSQSLIWTVNDLNERLKRANMNMPVLDKKRWHQANAWSGIATNTVTALLTSALTIFAGSAGDTYNTDLFILNQQGICWEYDEPNVAAPSLPETSAPQSTDTTPEDERRHV
jgi:hypothetical protein